MLKKCVSLALAIVLFNCCAVHVFAVRQGEQEARQAAKVKASVAKRGVGEKARIKVKLRDRTEVKGYVSQAGDDSFIIKDAKTGGATTIAYRDVAEVKGKGLSKGAKIAIYIGTGVGIAIVVVGLLILSEFDKL